MHKIIIGTVLITSITLNGVVGGFYLETTKKNATLKEEITVKDREIKRIGTTLNILEDKIKTYKEDITTLNDELNAKNIKINDLKDKLNTIQ